MFKRIAFFLLIVLFSGLISCNSIKSLKNESTKSFELGIYTTSTGLGGDRLEFKEDNQVFYYWYSDITTFDRKGEYELIGDTISIEYEPMLKIEKVKDLKEQTVIQYTNKNDEILLKCNVKLFYSGKLVEQQCDENGKVILNEKIETPDSIYFNWNFCEFELTPKVHKYVPNSDEIDSDLVIGFVHLKIILVPFDRGSILNDIIRYHTVSININMY